MGHLCFFNEACSRTQDLVICRSICMKTWIPILHILRTPLTDMLDLMHTLEGLAPNPATYSWSPRLGQLPASRNHHHRYSDSQSATEYISSGDSKNAGPLSINLTNPRIRKPGNNEIPQLTKFGLLTGTACYSSVPELGAIRFSLEKSPSRTDRHRNIPALRVSVLLSFVIPSPSRRGLSSL